MSSRNVAIHSNDVSLGPPDLVIIANTDLLDALVQEPNQILQTLSKQVSPVKLEEISVDPEGRVIIANGTFAKTLRDALGRQIGGGAASDINIGCRTQ